MSHQVARTLTRRALFALCAAGLFVGAAALAAPPVNTLTPGSSGRHGDAAIAGYDTVAYFTAGKPTMGEDRFVHTWMGAKWKFASRDHLELFEGNPEKYAPQYGGYCAYGVAQDNLVSIEPDKFKILDGKLYLNYSAQVQSLWLKDPAAYVKQADAKFEALLKQ